MPEQCDRRHFAHVKSALISDNFFTTVNGQEQTRFWQIVTCLQLKQSYAFLRSKYGPHKLGYLSANCNTDQRVPFPRALQ